VFKHPILTASIVTYQNNDLILERTVKNFIDSSPKSRLFVIDNSPIDAARELCTHPNIRYIFNGSNLGFGRAHNIVLREIVESSDYHLILNPDVYFESHIMGELIDYLEANPDVGLVMPKVFNPNGEVQRLCRLLPTPHQLISRRFLQSFKKLQHVINYEYEMQFMNYNDSAEVPFLSGCFMLIRNEALKKVGFFDENFFLYCEDIDLSRRIHQEYKTVYYPHVAIHHVHEKGSYKSYRLLAHNIYSAIYYFNKWGWIWDSERKRINRGILIKHQVNGYKAAHIH
jgi:GT2 family glycosyltransferase